MSAAQKNPVEAWLVRVARECGSPEAMRESGEKVSSQNTRQLIVDFAARWESHRRTEGPFGEI